MEIDQRLIDATISFLNKRFDKSEEDVVAAGAYLENGEMLFGISTDAFLDSVCLCAETGPICEAQKLNLKLTASVCILRENINDKIKFLTPCGVCQERLMFFGEDLSVAIPIKGNPTEWINVKLKELQPNHWFETYK
jgi:cytidine deaminase